MIGAEKMDETAILATASSISERTKEIEKFARSEMPSVGGCFHPVTSKCHLDQAIKEHFVAARIIEDHIICRTIFLGLSA